MFGVLPDDFWLVYCYIKLYLNHSKLFLEVLAAGNKQKIFIFQLGLGAEVPHGVRIRLFDLMRLDQMKFKWYPLRNIVIAGARSNRIHQRKTGYVYNQSKWGLYKQTKLRIIHNDYVYAIYFMANLQHQMCSIELWAICSVHLREFSLSF